MMVACRSTSKKQKTADDSIAYSADAPGPLKREFAAAYTHQLENLFDTALLKKNFNGDILVALKGNILYERYQGYSDLNKKDLLTDTTALHIASTSKTFTGIAILRLVQEGRISLNDSITKFFPSLPYPGITVKMLLSHRSGLPNYLYFMTDDKTYPFVKDWSKKMFSNQDVFDFLVEYKPPLNFQPGTHFSYSNTNFLLLSMITEKVTGQTFPVYMHHKFFLPLQMNHTYVYTPADSIRSTPSFTPSGRYWEPDNLDNTYGDKNIYTTPRDLLKWDLALSSGQVIGKALLDSAFIGYSFEKPSVHNYGLGWRLQFLPNGKKLIYHNGKWHGFNAAYIRLADEQVTIIILGNRFNKMIYNVSRFCCDIFGDYRQQENWQPAEDIDSSGITTNDNENDSVLNKQVKKKIHR